MKLEYKILWIDNDDKIYKDHQSIIEEHLIDLGFTPIIEKGTDYQAFDKFESNLEQFDLFLLDYKLDGSQNGNEIIKNIRDEHSIYTDVIFYSTLPDEVRQRIYEDKLNGVYYTSRKFDEFEEDVLSIIDVTIKKTQDVNNLRGLIMAEVAELDRIKKRIIQKYNPEADSDFKKYIKEDVFSKIKEDLESLKCLVKVEESECSHDEINLEELQNNFFYDSFKKSRTVNKIKNKKCNHIDFKHEDYRRDVIAKRNVLAHQKEDEDTSGKFLLYPNGSRLEFTEEHCIQIRKDIKRYKNILEQIANKLDE